MVTINARELRHFFTQRCCLRAQWEIRGVAEEMLGLVRRSAPVLFEGCGPACVSGRCPEKTMACGRVSEVKAAYRLWPDKAARPPIGEPRPGAVS